MLKSPMILTLVQDDAQFPVEPSSVNVIIDANDPNRGTDRKGTVYTRCLDLTCCNTGTQRTWHDLARTRTFIQTG
jgi:hypothetical protein